MANIETVKAAYGEYICRRCINRELGTHLKTNDCLYGIYPSKCACCGNRRNIVVGFRLSGRLKLLLKKSSQTGREGMHS